MNYENQFPKNFYLKIISFYFSFLLMPLSSCITQSSVEYLQDGSKFSTFFNEAQIDDYKLKPGDELYIQISSIDDATSNVFSSTNTQQNVNIGSTQSYGAYLSSYTVNRDGFLLLPVIRPIPVQGKSITQVSDTIKKSLVNILNQPQVTVKLVNRYISVLGEVKVPGHFVYTQDKLTIFDAISLAGDITDYGNRKEVTITRNEDGKILRISVDLTRSDILASNYYYLRPNDIIYIKPLRQKYWRLQQIPYAIILSTITTGLFFYSVFK